MRYHHQIDGEWVQFEKVPAKIACCDCGLVHAVRFRVVKNKLQLCAVRDARATGQTRRYLKSYVKVSVPDPLLHDLQRATRKYHR